jgi:hypothetical protein
MRPAPQTTAKVPAFRPRLPISNDFKHKDEHAAVIEKPARDSIA